MSNRTYICPDCRTSKRAEAAGGLITSLRCQLCGGDLWELSHKWRIPKKNDDKSWGILKQTVLDSKPLRASHVRKRGKQLLSQIDKQVESLMHKTPSDEKTAKIKKLKHERSAVLSQHFGKSN